MANVHATLNQVQHIADETLGIVERKNYISGGDVGTGLAYNTVTKSVSVDAATATTDGDTRPVTSDAVAREFRNQLGDLETLLRNL